MAKKETIHDKAFEVYKLKTAYDSQKDKIRKYLKRTLEKEYGKGVSWSELSTIQQDTLIYVTIRQTMLEKYVDSSKHKAINENIDKHIKGRFLESDKELKKHNSTVQSIFENYFNSNDSDDEKEIKYNMLCTTISNNNPHVPVPSFDEWIKHPLRPYDYIASFNANTDIADTKKYPTQSDIDHVVLQVLLKRINSISDIKELKQTIINIDLIEECLTYIKNFDIEPHDPVLTEYDPTLNIPREKQELIITDNRRYFTYKKMLEDLAFLK